MYIPWGFLHKSLSHLLSRDSFTSTTMLNGSYESRHPCHILILVRKDLVFYHYFWMYYFRFQANFKSRLGAGVGGAGIRGVKEENSPLG